MSDNKVPPPVAPPPLPEGYVLPQQLLEKWLQIPAGQYIQAQLTRHDIDQLFFALTKGFQAQQILHQCIIKLSNGDTAGAAIEMDRAQRLAIEGDNNARAFFTAIMSAVK